MAAPDCLLWLWATNPMLPQAIAVMEAWGFTFKTAGHWSKRNSATGKLAFGTGYILPLLPCSAISIAAATRRRRAAALSSALAA